PRVLPSTIKCLKRGRERGPRGVAAQSIERLFPCEDVAGAGDFPAPLGIRNAMNDVPADPADVPTRVTPMVEDRTERIDVVRTETSEPPPPVDRRPRWGGGWLILLGLLAVALAVALLLLASGAFNNGDNPSPSTTTLPIQNPPSATSTSVSQPTTSVPSTATTTVSTTATSAPTTTSSVEPTTTSSTNTTASTATSTTP